MFLACHLQEKRVPVVKYGGAFLLGKYPHNTDKKYQNDLLNALEQLITNSCGIMPEDASVEIRESFTKGVTTGAHREYITVMNSEISKAILGQTLSTEIGEKGSYAAAQAHNMVREDLAAADRRRVAAAFNRLSRVFTFFNHSRPFP
jgi:phage gp29-like protein